MSLGYLLQAVRDHLRGTLSFPGGSHLAPQYCDVAPLGQPPARMGAYYLGIDGASVVASDRTHIKEKFLVDVTITVPTGTYGDQRGEIYLNALIGVDKLERPIITAIHGSQALRLLANALAGTPDELTGDIYQQPLWYLGWTSNRAESGSWAIGCTDDNKTFWARTLRFESGLRVQALDVMH